MKIEVLYPSVANLYGENSQISFLKQCLPEAEWINTGLNDVPAFAEESVDMIYLGPMSERFQQETAKRLMPYKKRIEELIEKGTVFLIIGNALEIFGQRVENEDGTGFDCLGIFNTVAKRRMMARYNSIFLGEFENMKIVGFKAQFSHSFGEEKNTLFKALKGGGLSPENSFEGFRKNNFFATYLLGPLCIMNPEFTKYLLKALGIEDPALPYEKTLFEAYEKRLSEFEMPDIKLD